jgi:ubiquinone/menaquinone biosynthesis C-methylase UbiE
MANNLPKNWTGERLETFIHNENAIEHLHRYALAIEMVRGKIVLDIACGEGYGSSLLSQHAQKVTGVDIDTDTVEAARTKYQRSNLQFLQGSADAIPLADASTDIVVSFETLEHHDKHQEMLLEIKRVLKPGGILIMSTPDKKYYTDEKNYINPFHVKELYEQEFKDLIGGHFTHTRYYSQNMFSGSLIIPEGGSKNIVLYDGDYTAVVNNGLFKSMYFIVIASDTELPGQANPSGFTGSGIVLQANEEKAKLIREETIAWVKQSRSFKLGSLLLSPFRRFSK